MAETAVLHAARATYGLDMESEKAENRDEDEDEKNDEREKCGDKDDEAIH